MTREILARQAGLSLSYIGNIEKGKRPRGREGQAAPATREGEGTLPVGLLETTLDRQGGERPAGRGGYSAVEPDENLRLQKRDQLC
jgi:hypothetical protein